MFCLPYRGLLNTLCWKINNPNPFTRPVLRMVETGIDYKQLRRLYGGPKRECVTMGATARVLGLSLLCLCLPRDH